MMKVFVVDNGGQWTHREYRVLKYLGVKTEIIENTTPPEKILKEGVDALVLSGGSPSISVEAQKLGRESDYLELGIPILGICAGAQFIGLYYGGKVGPANIPEYGKAELNIIEKDDLFLGLPDIFYVWENHNDEIKELSSDFQLLASSKNCKIQAFRHKNKKIFGVQFHPEVENTEYGKEIFQNFLNII